LIGRMYFQAMFPAEANQPTAQHLYETQYVQAHSLDWTGGVGDVYYLQGDRFGWLNECAPEPTCIPYTRNLEKKMTLSVLAPRPHISTRNAHDYRLYDPPGEQELIGQQQKASLEELQVLKRLARSWSEER